MAGQVKQLYHCDRCGEVFRSSIKPLGELTCTSCGLPPVRDGFAQLAQMPALDHSQLDSNHGIAGKDEADFFSMQRQKKQKRAIFMYVAWFTLILSVLGIGYYVKDNHDKREKEREAINKDIKDHEKRESLALAKSMISLKNFIYSKDENERARHIYRGTEYLYAIRKYYENPINREPYKGKKLQIIESKLTEEPGVPSRLDLLIKIDHDNRYDQYFETVFWEVDDKWYLDWPQFVRLSESDWSVFVKNPQIVGEYTFRLYARKRGTDGDERDSYTELVFSKANNLKEDISSDSQPVLVEKGTKMEEEILEHIKKSIREREAKENVLGSFDTIGQSRVRVSVAHEEVDGERVLVLKQIFAENWFSAHPESKK